MTDDEEPGTEGWDAITTSLRQVYGDVEPNHYGAAVPWALGGPDPLDGVSVYRVNGAVPHWHFVSFGLTELYFNEMEDPDVSGFGFELTCRVAIGDEVEPPGWPISLMQNLARYVCTSGNVFDVGHHMSANGPICLESDTELHALAFASDTTLRESPSPYGRYKFLQVVGITTDELSAIQAWNTDSMLALMKESNPLLVTDLSRRSRLTETAFAKQIEERTQVEGSSCASLFNPCLEFTVDDGIATIRLGAKEVSTFAQVLAGRIPFGRALVTCPDCCTRSYVRAPSKFSSFGQGGHSIVSGTGGR